MINDNKTNIKNKKCNLIILSKDGINLDNNGKQKTNYKSYTLLTFKEDDITIRMNLSNSNKIDKEKILKTVTSMKQNLIDDSNEFNDYIKKDKNIKRKNDSEKLTVKHSLNLKDVIIFNKKKNSKINEKESGKTENKQSNRAMISKTNSEIEKYTHLDKKNKLPLKNRSGYISKISINEGEEIIDNNSISVYEYIHFNDENIKIKDKDSFNNNESNYMSHTFKKSNNLPNNIYNVSNFEPNNSTKNQQNLGNVFKFKNKFKKNHNISHNNIKNSHINSDICNSKNLINNYNNIQNDNISDNKNLITVNKCLKKQIDIIPNNNLEFRLSNDKNVLLDDIGGVLKINNQRTKCFICERYFKENRIYYPKCLIHSLCKKCLKNYYEDIFENNVFSLKCPDTNCTKEIDLNTLKNVLSNIHYEMFINNQNLQKLNNNRKNSYSIGKELYLKDTKIIFNSKVNNENIKFYTQKNVLDINSNEKIYMYKKNKDIYCNNCLKPTLFTKINGHFIKCLNCHYRICKYCFKKFDDFHMEIKCENHCKVYYRKDEYDFEERSIFFNLLIQLFFVFAIHYLMFAGIYFIIYRFCQSRVKCNNNKLAKCCFSILQFFISFTILLITCPFLIFIHPFFPSIVSFTDY